jgi:hypothetical protein
VAVYDTAGNGPSYGYASASLSLTSEEASLTVTGQDALGSVEIGFHQGTYCTTVATGAGAGEGPYGGQAGEAFPAGGSGSYNYSWSYVSGDNTQSINSTTAQSPTWTKYMCAIAPSGPTTSQAVWQCAVTDSQGHGPVTVNINVRMGLQIDND